MFPNFISVQIQAVPEPTGFALLAVGSVVLLGRRQRKKLRVESKER